MIKILCIGNSFSEDAMKYLHAIAKCGGMEVKTVNLYIGGCPLIKHWKLSLIHISEPTRPY